MTMITITQNTSVLVAIDIAKARHEVLIAVPGKKRRRRLTVLNELADFTRLITALNCACRHPYHTTIHPHVRYTAHALGIFGSLCSNPQTC